MLSKLHFLTGLADVKKFLPFYYDYVDCSIHNYKRRKKDFVMKKFIALSVAVIMLLFGFAAIAEVNVAGGASINIVCSDLKPCGNTHDDSI